MSSYMNDYLLKVKYAFNFVPKIFLFLLSVICFKLAFMCSEGNYYGKEKERKEKKKQRSSNENNIICPKVLFSILISLKEKQK